MGKTRAENNEVSWSTYGEWKGQLQAKREEVKKLQNKWECPKKMIENEEMKEAEKVGLEGGSDGLDEEADKEREEETKEMEKLKRMIEKMGWRAPWNTGSGKREEKGVKVVLEEAFQEDGTVRRRGREVGEVVV